MPQLPGMSGPPAAAQARFGFEDVQRRARDLARVPYEAGQNALPPVLEALNAESYAALRFRPDKALLAQSNGAFRLQLFHPGFVFRQTAVVNVVREGVATPVPFSSALFEPGTLKLERPLPVDLGFAGLRLHYPLNDPRVLDEVIAFLGGASFRILSRGQTYGLSARALIVNLDGQREDFARFREFWVETPAPDATAITLYGLLDCESLAGAYRFTLFPGEVTALEVSASLYIRKTVARLGLAPLTSMYLQGEGDRRPTLDHRPEVHDSDGLMVETETSEWLWRPLRNPAQIEISQFSAKAVKGYGLLQRDRAFDHYQDLDRSFERRPSYWVQPLEGFGEGRVELTEFPLADDGNVNIAAFFVPSRAIEAGQQVNVSYRLTALADEKRQHSGAQALNTWRSKAAADAPPNATRFIIDFAGGELGYYLGKPELVEVVPSADEGTVLRASVQPNARIKGFRASIDVIGPPGRTLNLRAFLRAGPKALSETWTLPWKVE